MRIIFITEIASPTLLLLTIVLCFQEANNWFPLLIFFDYVRRLWMNIELLMVRNYGKVRFPQTINFSTNQCYP